MSNKGFSLQVAEEKFCETTIGCRDVLLAPTLRDIIQTEYFRVVVVDDEDAVEICGALKVSIVLSKMSSVWKSKCWIFEIIVEPLLHRIVPISRTFSHFASL